jgi:hypothetical protein
MTQGPAGRPGLRTSVSSVNDARVRHTHQAAAISPIDSLLCCGLSIRFTTSLTNCSLAVDPVRFWQTVRTNVSLLPLRLLKPGLLTTACITACGDMPASSRLIPTPTIDGDAAHCAPNSAEMILIAQPALPQP